MPATKNQALTAAFVQKVKDAGQYTDGNGLTLRVDANGKRWIQRIRIDGKQHNAGLGSYPAVSLADARFVAANNLQQVREGNNPIQDKQQGKAERKAKASIPTFQQATEKVIELRKPSWSSEAHSQNWISSLERYAFPIIGKKQVHEITTADVMELLAPIWHDKATTARYVRQRVETVMDWAVAQGHRKDNPANGALAKALPKQTRNKEHFDALPYADIPATIAAIRAGNSNVSTRLATEFLILTAARAGEIRKADWSEIDWESAVWTVSPENAKMRRAHRVPLSDRAMEILRDAWELGDGEGLIFRSNRGAMLAVTAMWRCLKGVGVDATIHGFRSSFRDWMAENTGASWAVAETCLAHVPGNSTEQSYHRTDYLDLRRPLMQEWSAYLAG